MASSDDEENVALQAVSEYYFVDDEEEAISFVSLPIKWSHSDNVDGDVEQLIFLHGNVDNGLQKIYKQVVAWEFDLLTATPMISVLTRENSWFELQKPRKSFEKIIRKILITVHCLHYARRNPEASWKLVWDHLFRAFSSFEVRPSRDDLVDHVDLIGEAVKRDDSLARCKFLVAFLEEKPWKMFSYKDAQAEVPFIVDDADDYISEDAEEVEDDEDNEDDLFDSVCAFCDNGGELLCCEGRCMRSFHATVEDGEDSVCESLRFTARQVQAIQKFMCKNCQNMQHQCFACGELGFSDKSPDAQVFRCANATCGHYYHPHCVAKLLHPEDKVAAEDLQEKISTGESFACPIHNCCVCKRGENKRVVELQFAVCRRCPTSYHRKCLPAEIGFDGKVPSGVIARAWEDLLPNRVLIYCLKHEIDEQIGTPIRDHIIFPDVEGKKNKQKMQLHEDREKVLPNKRRFVKEDSILGKTAVKTPEKLSSAGEQVKNIKKAEKVSSGPDPLRKARVNDVAMKPLKGRLTSPTTKVHGSELAKLNKTSLGDRLYSYMTQSSEQVKFDKQDAPVNQLDRTVTVKNATRKMSSEVHSLDADSERRLLDLMKDAASSITLKDVIKKYKVPSTHLYSTRTVVDKTITLGKVEGTVEAVRAALKRLEEDGRSIEEAKAVCEPEILNQVFKWKNKLKVYLAPFLNGKRYTSFGRHFTKPDKLEQIVNKLHLYVQNGDMIVDFCCGANDFSCLMKKKLDEMGKKCLYKNYDVFPPKNDFNFEKRDWMTVRPNELPKEGSQLIMGLNPPFGVKAGLANMFIDKALEFKPKLIILIVPPETKRLDSKNAPYDLVWEDDQFCAGKSFYLPGSVDENDKQMDQWNATTPVLYLWSRRDWSSIHKAVAQKHGHPYGKLEGSSLVNDSLGKESPDKDDHHEAPGLKDDILIESKEQVEPRHGKLMVQHHKEKKRKRRRKMDGDRVKHLARDRYHESPSNNVVVENSYQYLEPPYGPVNGNGRASIHENMGGGYSMNHDDPYLHEMHRYSPYVRDGPGSISNYPSYVAEMERESELRSQIRRFGQDPDCSVPRDYLIGRDPGYGHMPSMSPIPYGHLGSTEPPYRMNPPVMDPYAPPMDEFNNPRMRNFGCAPPPLPNRDGFYDYRPPPGYPADPMGFAPPPPPGGPYDPYSPHNTAGWLND